MEKELSVYVSILSDSLRSKYDVVNEILKVTASQRDILLTNSEQVVEDFEKTMDKKEILIKRMQELDNGFESIYGKIRMELQGKKQIYKPQILEMQNLLRQITDCCVKIQALEAQNKTRLEQFISSKRKEIKDFQVNNKTANAYYQHMANQHQNWQSYFVDKKK